MKKMLISLVMRMMRTPQIMMRVVMDQMNQLRLMMSGYQTMNLMI